jgi:hypothetical protein
MKTKILNTILVFLILIILLVFIYYININYYKEFFTINNNTKIVFNNVSYGCGFFCYFNMVIAALIDNPNTTEIEFNIISKKSEPASYYVEEGNNLYNNLFIPYNQNVPINNVITIDHFIDNTEGSVLYFKAKEFFNENREQFRPFHNAYKKYIHLQPNISDKIKFHTNKLKEGDPQIIIIGILVRSAANGDTPGRDKYLNTIKYLNLGDNVKYFFCIDNDVDLEFYKEQLKPNYYLDLRRAPTNLGDAPHSDTELKSLDELEKIFIQVAVLSTCNILLHCNSNMAITSLFMNMEQRSIHVR